MRETGWSPICCRRCCLRELFPSKKLLLLRVIEDDNPTNNGETLPDY